MIILIDRTKEIQRRLLIRQEQGQHIGEQYIPTDFSKIRVGSKNLEDAILSLGDFKRVNPKLGDKKTVLKAISSGDIRTMQDISNFFYRVSGIYERLCKYVAYLYRYDWFITPYINNCDGLISVDGGLGDVDTEAQIKNKKKQFNNFFKVLKY